jgi:hypothetical protein
VEVGGAPLTLQLRFREYKNNVFESHAEFLTIASIENHFLAQAAK